MVRIPTHREPTHPGEMLLEEFIEAMGITQRELATSIHVPYQRVNEIDNIPRCQRIIYPPVSEDYWLNLQLRWDLYKARQAEETALRLIKPFLGNIFRGDFQFFTYCVKVKRTLCLACYPTTKGAPTCRR